MLDICQCEYGLSSLYYVSFLKEAADLVSIPILILTSDPNSDHTMAKKKSVANLQGPHIVLEGILKSRQSNNGNKAN